MSSPSNPEQKFGDMTDRHRPLGYYSSDHHTGKLVIEDSEADEKDAEQRFREA